MTQITTQDDPIQTATLQVNSEMPNQAAMAARIYVSNIQGPTRDGTVRGLDHLQLGFIQNAVVTTQSATYKAVNTTVVPNAHQGHRYLDIYTGIAGGTPNQRSKEPWADTNNQLTGIPNAVSFWEPAKNDQGGNKQFRISDSPFVIIAPYARHVTGRPLTQVNSVWDYDLWFAVRTTDGLDAQGNPDPLVDSGGAQEKYFQKYRGMWQFSATEMTEVNNQDQVNWKLTPDTQNSATAGTSVSQAWQAAQPATVIADANIHPPEPDPIFNDMLQNNYWNTQSN